MKQTDSNEVWAKCADIISRNNEFILPSALSPSTADGFVFYFIRKAFRGKFQPPSWKQFINQRARVSIPHGETNFVS